MVMWSLRSMIASFIQTSRAKDVPIPFDVIRTFAQSFDTFGRWLFLTGDRAEVESLPSKIEKALAYKRNKAFKDAFHEADAFYNNLKKLLI